MRGITLVAALAALLLAFATTAHAMSNGAPQLDCTMCHVDAKKNPAEFVVEGVPSSYEPGKEYRITVRITKGPESKGAAYGGFAVAVTGGTLVVVDSKNTLKSKLTVGGSELEAITHTKDGSMKREWTFAWKAPATCTGPVKMMIAVIAANGDGTQNGDAYGYKELTITCAGPKVVTVTTTITKVVTTYTYITTTKEEQVAGNATLAAIVAAILFVIGAGGYLAVRR